MFSSSRDSSLLTQYALRRTGQSWSVDALRMCRSWDLMDARVDWFTRRTCAAQARRLKRTQRESTRPPEYPLLGPSALWTSGSRDSMEKVRKAERWNP